MLNRKDQKNNQTPGDKTRYAFVHEQTSKNFQSISDKCISSAWEGIPELNDYLPSTSDDSSDEFFINNEN